MDDERLKQIWDIGFRYACRMNCADIADDFAQEYTMFCLRREKRGAGFQQPELPLIDFKRKLYGRFTNSVKQKRFATLPYDELRMPKVVRRVDPHMQEALDKVLFYCKTPIQRAAFVLRHVWGFNDIEIADVFQVTGSRICHMTKLIMDKAAAAEGFYNHE